MQFGEGGLGEIAPGEGGGTARESERGQEFVADAVDEFPLHRVVHVASEIGEQVGLGGESRHSGSLASGRPCRKDLRRRVVSQLEIWLATYTNRPGA